MITAIITSMTISTIIARSVQTSGGGGEYLQCSTLVGIAGHEGNSMQEMFLVVIIIKRKRTIMMRLYLRFSCGFKTMTKPDKYAAWCAVMLGHLI